MVVSLLIAFSALLFIVYPAGAQIFATNCTDSSSDWEWSLNSLGQDPCLVVAYLASVCNNGSFTISRLPSQHSYTGPSGPDNDDICKCNTVAYNLFSACDACQGEPWFSYSVWNFNCTAIADAGTFPEPVPAGTRVPYWAYIDITATDDWDLAAARLAGDSPEVTGSVPIVPTSTRKSQSTVAPKAPSSMSPSSSSGPSSNSSSNAGKIAGGVVGGLVVAALIAGIVFWFIIRRRHARTAPSSEFYIDGQSDTWKEVAPYSPTIETPRAYDPSDPSTYPTHMTQTTDYSGQSPGSRSELRYSGLPEIHQERPPALARGVSGIMM